MLLGLQVRVHKSASVINNPDLKKYVQDFMIEDEHCQKEKKVLLHKVYRKAVMHDYCLLYYININSEGYCTWFVSLSVSLSVYLFPDFLPLCTTRQQNNDTNSILAVTT